MKGLPPGAVTPSRTRVFLAVLLEHEAHRRVTVQAVVDRAGFSSTSVAWKHLCGLRDAGLVAWEPRKAGTLRPLVRRVEVTR